MCPAWVFPDEQFFPYELLGDRCFELLLPDNNAELLCARDLKVFVGVLCFFPELEVCLCGVRFTCNSVSFSGTVSREFLDGGVLMTTGSGSELSSLSESSFFINSIASTDLFEEFPYREQANV